MGGKCNTQKLMQPVAIGIALQTFLNTEQSSKPKAGGSGEDVY